MSWREFLREPEEAELPSAIRPHENTGRPPGDAEFVGKLETLLGRVLVKRKPGPRPKNPKPAAKARANEVLCPQNSLDALLRLAHFYGRAVQLSSLERQKRLGTIIQPPPHMASHWVSVNKPDITIRRFVAGAKTDLPYHPKRRLHVI